MTPEDGKHYCIQVRVTLRDGGGDQPLTVPCMGRVIGNQNTSGDPARRPDN